MPFPDTFAIHPAPNSDLFVVLDSKGGQAPYNNPVAFVGSNSEVKEFLRGECMWRAHLAGYQAAAKGLPKLPCTDLFHDSPWVEALEEAYGCGWDEAVADFDACGAYPSTPF